nr:uncharacterized protein LOC131788050 [Pocillopora verrucosa]
MEDTSLTNEVCTKQTKQNCVVSAGSYLYVFGEPPETRKFVVKAERYDTVDKKWEEIADMLEERDDAFGEATEDKIFVAGGKHRESTITRYENQSNVTKQLFKGCFTLTLVMFNPLLSNLENIGFRFNNNLIT